MQNKHTIRLKILLVWTHFQWHCHSSLRCCKSSCDRLFKVLVTGLTGPFIQYLNSVLSGVFWFWRTKKITWCQVRTVEWVRRVGMFFCVKNSLTANDMWLGTLSWQRIDVMAMSGSTCQTPMLRVVVKLLWTPILGSPISSAISLTFKCQFQSTAALIMHRFSSVIDVKG